MQMTITVGDGAELGHDVPERFRKLDAQQSSDMFEDEHGRKVDATVVDDAPCAIPPVDMQNLLVGLASRIVDTETCDVEVASWVCFCSSSRDVVIPNPRRMVLLNEGIAPCVLFAAELEAAAITEASS